MYIVALYGILAPMYRVDGVLSGYHRGMYIDELGNPFARYSLQRSDAQSRNFFQARKLSNAAYGP